MNAGQHRLYTDLAEWWPLMSPPSDYVVEAADLWPTLTSAPDAPPATLLELGSGGGSLAVHLKPRLRLTLTDRSPAMLAVNRALNPECEHLVGDMRTLDLDRRFDLVLVHDAIMYATTPADLQATMATAVRHCRPGGGVVLVPDCVKETFEPTTEHGGQDGVDGRALRYLEWTWDPDAADDTAEMALAFLLREADGQLRQVLDRHQFGLFRRDAWLGWLRLAGCVVTSRMDPWGRDVFVGRRPAER
jgi:SAM-dependent methyltransferase